MKQYKEKEVMKKPFLSSIALSIIGVLIVLTSVVEAKDQAALQKELAYLKDIPEISWVEFDRNNVYIGFSSRPSDLRLILSAAALIGNKVYGFGVHVWAVNAKYKGWRPGDGPCYCEATARYGKIESNSCR